MASMRNIRKQTYVCVDCESTGLDTQQDSIIEIAVAEFTFSDILRNYETLVDPKREIPESSIAIHHITQEMVEGKPVVADVLPKVLDIIGDHIIIGHGIAFDIQLIDAEAKRAGIPCSITENKSLDTLRMARLYGESQENSLSRLGSHFNVANEGAHRAMNDVRMNIEVFKHLCCNHTHLEKLFARLKKPIALRRMPLGKHKGRPFKDIPIEYLRWMARKDQDFDMDLIFSVRSEISRRKKGGLFGQAANPFQNL